MRINIITIGSFRSNDCLQQIFEEYKKRIRWEINLLELKCKTVYNVEEQKTLEGKVLLEHTNRKNRLVVLDERGKIIDSPTFSSLCGSYELEGGIDFIIGGADGLSQEVRDRADYMLSFGKMVFPHLLVRVMLMEQLYRAYTIKNNIKYHK